MDRVEREIAALRDANPYKREYAAAALGAARDPRAVKPLIECLRDHRGLVRESATRSLIAIGAASVEPVTALLRDPDADTRQVAVEILGRIGDRRAARALAGRLRDGSARVRAAAARGLGRLRDTGSVDHLLDALHDRKAVVRSSAAWALGQLADPRALDGLQAALADGDPRVRSDAATALGHVGGTVAAQALARCLDDEQVWVRWHALQALAALPEGGAFREQALGNANATVRMGALFVLGERRRAAARAAMRSALADPIWGVRWHAARALSRYGDGEAALEDVRQLIDDPDARVAGLARDLLTGVSGSHSTTDAPALTDHIAALDDPDEVVVQTAAEALGKAGNLAAAGPLMLALHDPYPEPSLAGGCLGTLFYAVYARLTGGRDFPSVPRAAVARTLAQLGDPRAIEPLIAALQDGEPSVRIAAAEGLARFADPQAREPLTRTLQDRHPAVRAAAAAALARLA